MTTGNKRFAPALLSRIDSSDAPVECFLEPSGIGTVDWDPNIALEIFADVYEPAHDSFLLLRALTLSGTERFLDMGCGTGVIGLHAAKKGCDVTAVDCYPSAVANVCENARKNALRATALHSDLFERVDGTYDVIAFNAPYLPTEHEHRAWDGGPDGTSVIMRFLADAPVHLAHDGTIYLVWSTKTRYRRIIGTWSRHYSFARVLTERFFFEEIMVYRLHLWHGKEAH
jgi:release factor glutamine methyltransferase